MEGNKGPRKRANGKTSSAWIRPEKRLAVYLRDGFVCLACGRDLHGADPRDVTLDHVLPRCKGGGNGEANIYTCCLSCNSRRQEKPLASLVGPLGLKRIRRNLRRSLTRYKVLAAALFAGTTGRDEAVEQCREENS